MSKIDRSRFSKFCLGKNISIANVCINVRKRVVWYINAFKRKNSITIKAGYLLPLKFRRKTSFAC